mmetsp:Transcript_12765/g.19318  ORF Transcript_12765/g.19318 Transcript_12765/m.19318 type:complete len:1005 (+) Transcript_12765:49-3063(+)|eukprot:CAMPEP_0201554876 /NCGR_PEP_ID=MMETSP0173_2-20130828/44914_1 /ASSEMBLY_ACC=CAM_ASM_000268 /TAXON_ID=218659 /ORGANISM="Vexillifera sp., Strain DIVA3 564/2" /LENGTH=1004 /DNA_ID=CAMNT_0047966395 /DNA_START=6 /DNA_END=3020 /DNA_ORIENTATION=+
MTDTVQPWQVRERHYKQEIEQTNQQFSSKASSASKDHPLFLSQAEQQKQNKVVVESSSVDSSTDDDPLGASTMIDPLGASSSSSAAASSSATALEPIGDVVEGAPSWSGKKAEILQKYTTSDRLVITANFMKETGHKVELPTDQVKARLEQLDENKTEEEQDMELTQKDYISHIENLHTELAKAWENEQRVKSLKIAIQCAKLLSDTTVIKFYPSKWVLVTEILDTFGRLVFQRIRNRSVSFDKDGKGPPKALPDNFKPEEVSADARETCRNWFFKIASIRELLPRLYIEMSILRCYAFLSQNSFGDVITRLCSMMRGLGDLLVSTSARAYLARVAMRVKPDFNEHLRSSFYDHIFTMNLLSQNEMDGGPSKLERILQKHQLSRVEYFDLYSPSVEWLLECLAATATKNVLAMVLRKYQDSNDGLILSHILHSFAPSVIASNAVELTKLVATIEPGSFSKSELYAALGVNLVLHAPASQAERLQCLNTVWSAVTEMESVGDYMRVAEVFIEFTAQHFNRAEVNTMLGDIVKHVSVSRAFEKHQAELQSTVEKVLAHVESSTALFAMDNLLPMLDLFRGSTQVDMSKSILRHFSRDSQTTSDPVIINTMFAIATIVHDSVNTLTVKDEVRQITEMITRFVRAVSFGRDVEKQMNFYVDCRRAFSNLDRVKRELVLSVCSLAMKTHSIVKGKHTKKTAAFVRACIAFCYITIPSMDDPLGRVYLYRLSAEIALANQSVHQAESLYKAAIMLIKDVPALASQQQMLNTAAAAMPKSKKSSDTAASSDEPDTDKSVVKTDNSNSVNQIISTEEAFVSLLQSFVASLISMPGHPEIGPFALQEELIDAIETYPWQSPIRGGRIRASLALLTYFSAMSQQELPRFHRVERVESNIYLFGGDANFAKERDRLTAKLIENIQQDLKTLETSKDSNSKRTLATIAQEIFDQLVSQTNVPSTLVSFILELVSIITSNTKAASTKHYQHTLAFLNTLCAHSEPHANLRDAISNTF